MVVTARQTLRNSERNEPAILDKMNGTFRPPLHPISMMLKWRVLVFARLHHCFGGGERGLIVPFYSVQDCNLGKNEWNISTTPPSISMMLKWRVLVFAPLRHCFGGGGKGVNCSFLFCPRLQQRNINISYKQKKWIPYNYSR